ncbi:MAG: hypothetical protein WCV99_18595 [Sterolibacterium sp.]
MSIANFRTQVPGSLMNPDVQGGDDAASPTGNIAQALAAYNIASAI